MKSKGLNLNRGRGFTLVELIAVIVVLAILSGVAIPRYFDYAARARTAALEGSLGAIRSGIANYMSNESINGTAAYPTLAQLTTLGTVMTESLPKNPYNNLANVAAPVDLAAAQARTTTGTTGWMYYMDNTANPPIAIFFANSTDTTTASDGAGGYLDANEL